MKASNRNDKMFSVRMPGELFERISAAAQKEDLTAGQFIRRAAEQSLQSRESPFQKSLRGISGK